MEKMVRVNEVPGLKYTVTYLFRALRCFIVPDSEDFHNWTRYS
jgi:hypothetical protein